MSGDGKDISAPWSKALRLGCAPVLLTVGTFGAFVAIGAANLPWPVGLAIFAIQGAAAVAAGLSYRGAVDSAKLGPTGLQIARGAQVQLIAWSEVAVIEASKWRKDRLVTLHARQPGHGLAKIRIIPNIAGLIWPGQASPVANEIAKRCPKARRIGF